MLSEGQRKVIEQDIRFTSEHLERMKAVRDSLDVNIPRLEEYIGSQKGRLKADEDSRASDLP